MDNHAEADSGTFGSMYSEKGILLSKLVFGTKTICLELRIGLDTLNPFICLPKCVLGIRENYSWPLNNSEVRDADPLCSQKCTDNL